MCFNMHINNYLSNCLIVRNLEHLNINAYSIYISIKKKYNVHQIAILESRLSFIVGAVHVDITVNS